jgi:hypothetical protein
MTASSLSPTSQETLLEFHMLNGGTGPKNHVEYNVDRVATVLKMVEEGTRLVLSARNQVHGLHATLLIRK